MGKNLSASIIVPTYNRWAALEITLNKLLKETENFPDVKIYVIDNGSMDATKQGVQKLQDQHDQRIQYFIEKRNGLHYARHLGAKAAESSILIYIDDDVTITEEWLPAMMKPFEDENIAVVGGKIIPDFQVPPPNWVETFHPGYLSLLDLGENFMVHSSPENVYGCNMAVRRDVLFEVGGFNPDGFAQSQYKWYRGDGETGFVWKVYMAKYLISYEPKAILYHRIPQSRLTAKYYFNRAAKQAISDGFSQMRGKIKKPSLDAADTTQKSMRLKKISMNLWKYRVWLFSKIVYYWYRGLYLFHYFSNKALRKHVAKENYLD